METILTIIVDNKADDALLGEWGLSVLAEYEGKKILLDAGASSLAVDNMQKLGTVIEDIDFAVLSHAHYDHANGMPAFLEKNKKAKLYMRESANEDCYARKFLFRKYIGIRKNMLADYSDRIQKVSGDYKVTEGVYLIPHKTDGLDRIGKREMMCRKTPGGWILDDFAHEQSLVLDTDKGLVILNSCSHGGVYNIINEVKSTFPDKRVYGLIGGFHLFNKTDAEIYEVVKKIRETKIEYICTGHCTKDKAFSILKEELGDMVNQMHTGYRK